ncbi:hypothetical protein [Nocardia farcinica]|uniref:hypothetical protein n=1 Tax=Nocardia farcinica TaxID=37329 RepID=UPI0018953864|nr:hypothetical protein [Nocardia farcinica]MBF6444591.1 hypothetical protein [Nocardia farcinica]
MSPAELARRVEVDPKTVERWITTGRVPYRTHQFAVEDALGIEAAKLWPGRTSRVKQPAQANERLRCAIFDARLTFEQLSEAMEVDPKTVQRWVAQGAVPHPSRRQEISVAVGVPEAELWPEPAAQRAARGQRLYTGFSDTPAGDGTTIQTSARLRACMSWVDQTSPLKESEIHSRQITHAPERPYRSYSRGSGVTRER